MRLPGPVDLLRVGERGYEAIEAAIGLVPRLVSLVGEVEQIVARARQVVGEIEMIAARAQAVVGRTEKVVTAASATVERTERIVARTDGVTNQLIPVLERLQPTLVTLQPMLDRLADTTSADEVDALVKLIDNVPELVGRLDSEIFPVLDTLGTVAPDLRDLLDMSRELNEMLGSLPGLGRVKKRIEAQQAEEDARETHTADDEPPARPDRD